MREHRSLLLCVSYTAKPGKKELFVKEIENSGILEKIRKEAGCLGYDYFYPASGNEKILLVEKWESEELQQAHLKQAHMEELKAIKDKYIKDTSVEKAYMD